MRIREGTSEDVPDILDLHVAAVKARGPTAYDDEQVAAWADRGDATDPPLDDPTHHVVVCERDGDVVGFGDLDTVSGEVCGVYVHPDRARGGVGSAILEHLEDRALEAGFDETNLLASKNAIDFYERRGYEREETVSHETIGGVEIECVRMSRQLSNEPL